MEILNFNINSDDEGQRIDKYLSNIIEGKSRSFIQGLIDEKKVKANNKVIKSNYKVKKDDFIEVCLPEPVELNVSAEEMNLDIASEYLVTAAELLEMKSRYLLPKPPKEETEEDELDPEEELKRRLLEYQKYYQHQP